MYRTNFSKKNIIEPIYGNGKSILTYYPMSHEVEAATAIKRLRQRQPSTGLGRDSRQEDEAETAVKRLRQGQPSRGCGRDSR